LIHLDQATVPRRKIGELVDILHIQALAEANFHASGLPMSIVDATDSSMLVRAGWRGMCQDYHRARADACRRCQESDQYVASHLGESESIQYKCKNGLWHIGIPIVVDGIHMATLFISQFFIEGETIDREFFIRQGQEFGFEIDAYLAALQQLPVFSEQKIAYALAFYKVMARFIVEMAEQSLSVIRAKDSLREKDEYQSLVHNVNIGVYRLTLPDRFVRVNRAMARIFGYESVDELLNQSVSGLYLDLEERTAIYEELAANGTISGHILPMNRKDGSIFWASMTARAEFDPDGSIRWVDGVIEDVTLRKKETDDLRDQSEKDALTAVYNRRKLFEMLSLEAKRARRYGRPLSIIFFDIDRFKATNDQFGHEVGDEVLKITAEIVGNTLRETDVFARYGGDEFTILCPETDVDAAGALAEKIRAAVEQRVYPVAGTLTISAGVALYCEDDPTGAASLKRADQALYIAKSCGRNAVKVETR
jgi:diguanylate cyclase (GGDEF)-like protein/PAS domain S-box-containing protein